MLERPGSPPIPLIRLAHPMAFAGFLDHVGAPTNRLFRRNGLPVYCDDPTAFVPLRQAWSLFDDAARCEDQMLGWEIGKFYGDGRLSGGLLSRIEHAPTLYQGLRRLSRLVSSEASHLELGVVEGHDHILFTTQYTELKDWPGYASSQSYQIEVYVDLIRQYLGRDWMPTEIGIELERVPRIAQEHFPGTRIRPRQRMGYIALPRSCLHAAPLGNRAGASPRDDLSLTDEFGYLETLKELIRSYMAEGYPAVWQMAALMDMSPRTLMRRLSERHLSYQRLVDEQRFNTAKELLGKHELSVFEVAARIGFNDAAHFSRMFRRVGGLSPVQFRNATRA